MDDKGAIQYSAACQTHRHGVYLVERRDVAGREGAGKELGRKEGGREGAMEGGGRRGTI